MPPQQQAARQVGNFNGLASIDKHGDPCEWESFEKEQPFANFLSVETNLTEVVRRAQGRKPQARLATLPECGLCNIQSKGPQAGKCPKTSYDIMKASVSPGGMSGSRLGGSGVCVCVCVSSFPGRASHSASANPVPRTITNSKIYGRYHLCLPT